jgi:3',5'-cyclic AMP phosphodiesterase CpdA
LRKYGNDNDNNNNNNNTKKKIKIIAMHHHLIAIPDTGTDKIIIVDAGDTLRDCLQSGVDLMICGHKHRPWLWNLGALQTAYAGTASSERYRGFFENAYNIVDIKDGKVSVDMKIVGGKRMPLIEIVEKYKPFLETQYKLFQSISSKKHLTELLLYTTHFLTVARSKPKSLDLLISILSIEYR